MSTTGSTEQGTVYVLDEPDAILKKFKRAVTDSGTEIVRGGGQARHLGPDRDPRGGARDERGGDRAGVRRRPLRRLQGRGGGGGRRVPRAGARALRRAAGRPGRARGDPRRRAPTAPARSPPRRSSTCASGWASAPLPSALRPSLSPRCPPPPSITWSSTSTSSPGPFDLLLSLILREELDLLEVELADVVLAYLDHLEARDELDLEATTEFLVLIAALLELKSRLMLPGEEVEELDELVPAEAAEELLERMLRYARFRGAAGWLRERAGPRRGGPLPLGAAARRAAPAVGRAGRGLLRPRGARRRARRAAAHAAAGRPQPHGERRASRSASA